MKLLSLSFVVTAFALSLSSMVLAQDTSPPPSTVIKNHSPIDLTPLDLKIPRAKVFTLPNGAHVFVIEDHRLPTFSVSVSVRAGSLFENPTKPGVSDLVASTLDEGTKTKSADAISDTLDRYGANLSASAGTERASVSVSGLAENADLLLAVLADVVKNPTFPEERFARVRFRAAAGAAARATDPNTLAAEALKAALYGADSPYGRPAATPAQITAITSADLAAFHKNYFRPDSAIIGVAGDVDATKIVDTLRTLFEDWKADDDAAVSVLPQATLLPAKTYAPVIVDRPGSAQTVLLYGIPGVQRSDPDYFPLFVANRVLGGGFNSRLNQKLREEKGYTYGARSTLNAPKWQGTWEASASVRTPVTVPAAQDFLNEFSRLETVPPKQGELDSVKQSIIGGFALTLESPEAILARNIEQYEYNLPADYWDTYAAKIRAVTPEDVIRVARKYFGGGDVAAKPMVWSVAVGEKSAIESGLNGLGK